MKIINLFIIHTLSVSLYRSHKKTEPVSCLKDKINLNQLMLKCTRCFNAMHEQSANFTFMNS